MDTTNTTEEVDAGFREGINLITDDETMITCNIGHVNSSLR
jgi:hypothetical protein